MRDLQRLVDAADEAALLRAVDGLCATRDWDDLVDLARRCRDAVELGKQLWPVATHVDYRLALEAPAAYAAGVLRPGAGRFALGPLTEVAAGGHRWEALAPHVGDPASAGAVAQERVLRGEDLRGRLGSAAADLPPVLAAFEPDYALPTYRDREARFPPPAVATDALPAPRRLAAGDPQPEDEAAHALLGTVGTWTAESTGSARAAVVAGGVERAIGALVPEAAVAEIGPRDALALLQWAGASGGARGRRRGGSAGRFAAWWAVAALAGLDWPEDPAGDPDFVDDLADGLDELRWYRWAPPGQEVGWVLRVAVADPVDGLAWALDATDVLEDDADGTG